MKTRISAIALVLLVLFVTAIVVTPAAAYDIKKNYTRISRDLEKARGMKFKSPVPYSMKTKAYLKQFLVATFKKEMPPPKLRATDVTLKLFGFVPQNFDTLKFLINLYTEQIAGMYNPASKQMLLMEGGTGMDENSPEAMQMKAMGIETNDIYLIHEMDHALQDQHFNLTALISKTEAKKNDDRTTAMQALMEGDATLIMMSYMLNKMSEQMGGADVSSMIDMSSMREMVTDSPMGADQKTFANAPLFFKRQLIFPYIEGMVFCDKLKKRGGWALVNKAYSRLPLSTEQIYHPEKYLSQENPIRISFDGLSKSINGFTVLDENTVGEMGMRIYFEQFMKDANFKGIAAGWGGDKYRIYSKGNDHFLVWYTTWDSDGEAREFFNAYIKLLGRKYSGVKWVQKAEKPGREDESS